MLRTVWKGVTKSRPWTRNPFPLLQAKSTNTIGVEYLNQDFWFLSLPKFRYLKPNAGFKLKIWLLTLPTASSIQEKARPRSFQSSFFPLGASMPSHQQRHLLWCPVSSCLLLVSIHLATRTTPQKELHIWSWPQSPEPLNRKLCNTPSSRYKHRYIKIQVTSHVVARLIERLGSWLACITCCVLSA
jgi:hypothetical protein